MLVNFLIFFTIFTFILIFFCKKFNILIDQKIEKHKKYSTKNKSYLLGGILIMMFLSYYLLFITGKINFFLFVSSIFFIGISADTRAITSVSLRFLLQLTFIACFVNLLNMEINSTKIDFFDKLLEIDLINILFVSFCLLVLLNGSNFIDGINGVTVSYFLIIFLVILMYLNHFNFDKILLINISFALVIILVLNFFGVIYLGDSGSYTLSLFTGIFLINFASENNSISPYFMIVLLWYPCFELLFSIIRRSLNTIRTYKPDTRHLHHLIYKKIKSKFYSLNNIFLHFITTCLINLYNLTCFLISLKFLYVSEILLSILITNILIYITLYNYLKK